MVLERRSEYSELSSKSIVEGFLGHVNFCDKNAIVHLLDDCVVVHQAEWGTIVWLRCAPAECEIVIIYKSCAGNDLISVRVEPSVIAIDAQSLCGGNIFCGVEHFQMFVHPLETYISFIGYLKTTSCSFFRFDFNHTWRSTWTVHCCLRGILQYPETLDVCRVDGWKGEHVRSDPVNQHQGIIATDNGCRTTHPHAIEHSHPVQTVECHVDTGCLTAQYVKGVIDHSFAGVISNYLYDVASALSGISQFCRNLLLCVSHWTAESRKEK